MKSSNQIRQDIAAVKARVEAVVELATSESREINADEQAIVDAASQDLPALESQLENAVKIEAIVASKLTPERINQQSQKAKAKEIAVPARAKLHGKLVAFNGPNADRDAYVTGRWVAANFFNHAPSKRWMKENGIRVRNAMSESEDDRGGVFVPTEMSTNLIRLVEEYGVIRANSMIEPMGSDAKTIPVRVSGLTATPVGETTRANEGSNTVAAQDVIYTNLELVARKWKVVVKISDELNEDTLISLADQVTNESALAFAYAEDNAGFNGDGTSTYHGITGILKAVAAGSIYAAASGNTAFSTLDLLDFITMKGKLPRIAGIQPAWYISQEGYCDSMERLLLAAGGNAVVDIANGGVPRFLGAPVIITNVLNSGLGAQASTNLLAYGDLRMATRFGDRRMMTMSLTDQRYWDEDQIAIKATERFDFKVCSPGTATAAGAVLVLQTPAS